MKKSTADRLWLQTLEVFGSRAFFGLNNVKLYFLTLFEVRAADIFHMEEHVVVSIFCFDESVTACVVKERNRTLCHSQYLQSRQRYSHTYIYGSAQR